jgi:hypothetical protein
MYVSGTVTGLTMLDSDEVLRGQKTTCDQRDTIAYGPKIEGSTIFPGGPPLNLTYNVALSRADWDKGTAELNARQRTGILPIVTGCIDYQIPGDAKHHHTRFAYMVGRRNDSDPTHPYLLPADPTSVPQDHIVFVIWPMASTAAAD